MRSRVGRREHAQGQQCRRLLPLPRVRDPGTADERRGVDIAGHHIEISENEITGSVNRAVFTDEPSHHVHFLRNWIHHNGRGLTEQSHGVYLQGDDQLVANNVIHDQPEGFGVQVYDQGSRAVVVGNTITHSGSSGIVLGGGGGVDHVRIHNNILAFNGGFGIETDSTCPTASIADHNVSFSNLLGPFETECSSLDLTGGNLTTDPRFVDAANRDLHVGTGSPAIDYGLLEYSPTTDHAGNPRTVGSGPDAGAYEYNTVARPRLRRPRRPRRRTSIPRP